MWIIKTSAVFLVLVLTIMGIVTDSNASTIAGENWVQYFKTQYNQYNINPNSIRREYDGSVTSWVKWEFDKPEDFNGIKVLKIRINTSCEAGRMKSVEAIAYKPDGSILTAETNTNELNIKPGTANESTLNYICSHLP